MSLFIAYLGWYWFYPPLGSFVGVCVALLWFVTLTIFFNLTIAVVLCVKLLTAGHVALTVGLEEHILEQMVRPASQTEAIIESIGERETHVQGAMAVSNAKLWRMFWLVFFLIIMLIFTMLMALYTYGEAWASSGDAVEMGQVGVLIGLLFGGFAMLAAFMELLRESGDALDDLIQRMESPSVSAKSAVLFSDPMYLSEHFGSRQTARSLCWVLLTSPVNSVMMFRTVGGVAVAAILTLLPHFLGLEG